MSNGIPHPEGQGYEPVERGALAYPGDLIAFVSDPNERAASVRFYSPVERTMPVGGATFDDGAFYIIRRPAAERIPEGERQAIPMVVNGVLGMFYQYGGNVWGQEIGGRFARLMDIDLVESADPVKVDAL